MGAGGALELTMARHHPTMPPVTQADLAQAWARYGATLRGPNVPANLAQALAHEGHGCTVRIMAANIRKARFQATVRKTVDLVPAVRPGVDGHPIGWVTRPGSTWYDQPTDQPQQQSLL